MKVPSRVLVGQRILLLGAGGLAIEVADLVRVLGGVVAAYYEEDAARGRVIRDIPVVGDEEVARFDAAVLAVGDTYLRRRFFQSFNSRLPVVGAVHPSASVSGAARTGQAVVVMQNVVVSAEAQVGDGCLLNVGCYVAHHCRIGDFAHVGPGALLGGHSTVGDSTVCGLGTIVMPRVHVGSRCICGAGSVCGADASDDMVLVGVPAREIRPVRCGEPRC